MDTFNNSNLAPKSGKASIFAEHLQTHYRNKPRVNLKALHSEIPALSKQVIGGHMGQLARHGFVEKAQDGEDGDYIVLKPLENLDVKVKTHQIHSPRRARQAAPAQERMRFPLPDQSMPLPPSGTAENNAPNAVSLREIPSPSQASPVSGEIVGQAAAKSAMDVADQLLNLAAYVSSLKPDITNEMLVTDEDLVNEIKRRLMKR